MSAVAAPLGGAVAQAGTPGDLLRRFLRSPAAVVALAASAGFCVLGFGAPWIAPQNPYDLRQVDILDSLLPPGSESFSGMTYWLGTDGQGRDMLSAMLYGIRISLVVGIASGVLALAFGTLVGLVAAYRRGWTDMILMRIVDLQLSFPTILVALILLVILGRGVDKIIFALVVVQWAYFARTVRGVALVEGTREYVDAARGLRLGGPRILIGHILPNCLPTILVVATMQMAAAISLEATLSFLGLGPSADAPVAGPAHRQRLRLPAIGALLDQRPAGPRAPGHHHQCQRPGRPAARRAEPAALTMAGEAILELRDLRTAFGDAKALRGVLADGQSWRDRRPRGRERLGKVADGPVDQRPDRVAGPRHRRVCPARRPRPADVRRGGDAAGAGAGGSR